METFSHQQYDLQLSQKELKLADLFSPFFTKKIDVFSSAPVHYRMRAEFRVWHEGDDLYYYMFDKIKNEKIRTDQFPPASLLINEMMAALMSLLRPNKILRHKLFQVDFLSTLSGEILVTLLYHRQLDDSWRAEALQLKNSLQTSFNVHIIGRARKQKIDIERDFVIETLPVDGQNLIYKQIENSFTQPNARVAIKMLEWAISATRQSKGDLLELYCGNGNFSIALAKNFRRVLATELSGPSVQAAQYNIAANKVENLQIIRMSAEEFSEAMAGKREFQRLKGINLQDYDCHTILVDPPRAGLDNATLSLVQQYEKILYISCNPLTLYDNMSILNQTHEVTQLALFDQFPYTEHMECGIILTKRTKGEIK